MIRRGLKLLVERRDFRSLMGAQFLAQAGDGIVQAAIAKLIVFGGQKGFDLEDARSPDEILRIALYIFVPYTVLSPFLGVLIDRWDRRRLLFIANGFRAVTILLVGLVGTETVPEATLFLAFLLTLSSTRLVLATKAAALPATVGPGSLMEGNAVSQLGGAMFQLGGAGLAVIAAESIDADPIVVAGALVYAAGAAFSLGVRHAGEPRPVTALAQEIARVIRDIVAGLKEVARTPKAAASIATYFWLRLLWSFTLVGVGLIVRDLVGDEDLQAIAVVGIPGAVGAALGFLLADRLRIRVRSTAHLVLAASSVGGLAVAALGGFDVKVALGSLTFFLGFGFFLAKISLDTMVQEALGDDFRGRAFSLYDIAYNLAWVVAAGIMKLWWSKDSRGALIAGMGVVFLIGVAALGTWFKRSGLLELPTVAPAGAER
ncbi:MAG: MFS transporter [Actinomycetota bacterium]